MEEEHAYWKQRAKVTWLTDGDRNTKYFHRKASNRRAKNKLQGLFDSQGVWQETDVGIEGVVVEYFTNMFKAAEVDVAHMKRVVDLLSPKVTEDMNRCICAEFQADEIKEALFQMYRSQMVCHLFSFSTIVMLLVLM